MSTPTTPMTVPGREDARAYVDAVRGWLDDLTPEEVDDLTLGMEADLAERAAEGDVRLGDLLGDPEAYAAELRSAAGVPPRATPAGAPPARLAGLRDAVEQVEQFGRSAVRRAPWLRELRPLWWAGRGAVLAWLLVVVLGLGPLLWPLLAAAAAASFWFGLRTVTAEKAGRPTGVWIPVLNVVAVTALVWGGLLVATSLAFSGPTTYSSEPVPLTGVTVDGAHVQDLFVYDAQGHRVEGARIFDQSGQGLFVDAEMLSYQDGVPMRPDGIPDVATDVFPLDLGNDDAWANPTNEWTPPLTLPPLPGASSTDAPSPSPSPSPSASPSAAESPTSSPAPTPTDG